MSYPAQFPPPTIADPGARSNRVLQPGGRVDIIEPNPMTGLKQAQIVQADGVVSEILSYPSDTTDDGAK
jgi:hypothetical protein